MTESGSQPVAPKVAPRDRGARRFVTFTYLVIGGVIAYALISAPAGFVASVNKLLTATPTFSAPASASPTPTATPERRGEPRDRHSRPAQSRRCAAPQIQLYRLHYMY